MSRLLLIFNVSNVYLETFSALLIVYVALLSNKGRHFSTVIYRRLRFVSSVNFLGNLGVNALQGRNNHTL